MTSQRVGLLAAALEAAGLDAIVLIPGGNLYYTLGAKQRLTERPNVYAVYPNQDIFALLPAIEVAGFQSAWPEATVVPWTDRDGYGAGADQLGACLRERARRSPPKVAVEYLNLRIVERELLLKGIGEVELVPAEPIMDGLRMIKGPDEMENMRQSCRIVEAALQHVLSRFEYGMTEKQISNLLKIEMLQLGSEELPVEPVVASGARTSHAHTKTSERAVNKGDALLIDVGARYHGYISDLTRTFFVGEPPQEFSRLYQLDLEVRKHTLGTIRPGVPIGQVDQAAHDYVDQAGYGPCFQARVGHGIGLDAHEQPYIVRGTTAPLRPGMTFTVEPGIFLQDKWGVRTEENVAVTESGVEVLTSFPLELSCL
ncbi:MAG: M24 family metallopeptidase [Chloroflexota bacterium]